jgi:hypothetical protein
MELRRREEACNGIVSKDGTERIARQRLEAGGRKMCKGEVKLCLTGSGLEGVCG